MPDSQLIKKFFEGRTTGTETRALWEYLSRDGADLTEVRAYMETLWDPREPGMISSEKDGEILHRLRRRLYPDLHQEDPIHEQDPIHQEDPMHQENPIHQGRPGHQNSPMRHERPMRRIYFMAAACLAPLLVILGIVLFRSGHGRKQPSWQRLGNATANTSRYVLPDSTTVWLAPHSTLDYATDFGRTQRQLRLQGEAFFDVRRDQAHPFILSSNNIRTTVLGTSFNVEAYPKETDVRVSLVSGKVLVEGPAGSATGSADDTEVLSKNAGRAKNPTRREILSPGQVISWQAGERGIKRDSFKLTDIGQWTKGYMIFKDILLTDALQRITTRYGLRLRLAPGIVEEHRRITTMLKDDPMDEMLHIMPFITPYRYVIRDQVLVVDRK